MEASETPAQTPEDLTQQFKKDELITAAEVQGVEVRSADTKADIAEKIVQAGAVGFKVRVDNTNRRSDADAMEGSFVKILSGEHAGQIGSYKQTLVHGPDGWPELVQVKLEDATYHKEFVSEPYSNVRTIRQHQFL